MSFETPRQALYTLLFKVRYALLNPQQIKKWLLGRRTIIQAISMIASANLLGMVLGIVGSLVQAHFITPDDLGFVRKYSVIAGYAIFLNLGLFSILQREYPVLVGRGELERARRTVAIVQSWCLLASAIVCGGLFVIVLVELFQGHFREAAAWFIQIVAVWSTLYLGYLTYTFRSGNEFTRLAKGNIFSSVANVCVLPLFLWLPFLALVLRSVVGQITSLIYLYRVRPVQVGWYFKWDEFLQLVKRGLRLYVGTYLRYSFWLTVEIWIMYQIAGDKGVGLLLFSKMIIEASSHISVAINQVFVPRIAQRFGEVGKVSACAKMLVKPVLLNFGISCFLIVALWLLLPPVVSFAFPKYAEAIPLLKLLAFELIVGSVSLPVYMVSITESYRVQFAAAVVGLMTFVFVSFFFNSLGFEISSVAWGTILGQLTFVGVCFLWFVIQLRKEYLELMG